MTCTTLVLLKAEESSLAATELMLFTALPLTTSLLAVDTAVLLPVLLSSITTLSTITMGMIEVSMVAVGLCVDTYGGAYEHGKS